MRLANWTGVRRWADSGAVPESPTRMHISTADPEEAHEWLRGAYADHSARLSGNQQAFRFTHSVADCGTFKVGVCRHSMTLNGEWDPLDDQLLFSHLLSGRFTIGCRQSEVAAGPGDVFAYDPDVAMAVEWSDIRMAQVRMARGAFDRIAAELTGDERSTGFALARPLSEAKAQHWRRFMQYVTSDVATSPVVHGSPLVMSQVFRMIVATALETFPHSAAGDRDRPGGYVPAAAVRRALTYIDEHAGDDIALTDIADAAGVGPRALQRAFRRARDTTPLGQLRSVRLERAHQELRAADPGEGATVAAVAARWGFGHPGRFAVDYRARYGCSPSDTLRG
jgi:AraC-like DNA-binding protein